MGQPRPTILIVDHTPEHLDILKGILMEEYTVRPAVHGQLALRLANMEPQPDMILLDVALPDMDGYEVCRQLKANGKTRCIPVMFVTARTAPEDELQGFRVGAVDYIAKPVSAHVLRARIHTQLTLHRSRHTAEGMEYMEHHDAGSVACDHSQDQVIPYTLAGRALMRQFMDIVPLPVFLLDGESRLLLFNRALVLLTGLGHERLETMALARVIGRSGKQEPSLASLIRSVMDQPDTPVIRQELEFPIGMSGHGPAAYMEVILTRCQQEGGDASCPAVMGVLMDLTERHRLAGELHRATMHAGEMARQTRQASRARSDFLANMNHELRTPIHAITGFVHLCQQTPLTSQQQEYLEKINVSATALLRLVNNLLDLSRVGSDTFQLNTGDFVLREVVHGVMREAEPRSQIRGLAFRLEIDPRVPVMVRGDAQRLAQVLTCLVDNAIKFTHRGEVGIRVEPVGGQSGSGTDPVRLLFVVHDSGIGMAADQIRHLFQEFVQGDASATRRYGGVGLGLAVSHQLLTRMGGQIRVESELGRGSRVMFTLSFAPSDQMQPAADPWSHQDQAGSSVDPVVGQQVNAVVDVATLMPLWKRAYALLLTFDSEVEQVLRELEPLATTPERRQWMIAMKKAMGNYDLETCLVLLQRWLQREGVQLEEDTAA